MTIPAPEPALDQVAGRFRKKPVVIEAWPFDGSHESAQPVIALSNAVTWYNYGAGGQVTIRTLEGLMTANRGDWIIRGVKGEFYPCKPDIFAETYESAAATSPAVTADVGALAQATRVLSEEFKRAGLVASGEIALNAADRIITLAARMEAAERQNAHLEKVIAARDEQLTAEIAATGRMAGQLLAAGNARTAAEAALVGAVETEREQIAAYLQLCADTAEATAAKTSIISVAVEMKYIAKVERRHAAAIRARAGNAKVDFEPFGEKEPQP